jgi:hypothetical protein
MCRGPKLRARLCTQAAVVAAVLATLVGRSADAAPQLHAALTAGAGYEPVAPFDETGSSPFFLQAEVAYILDPIQRFSHGFSLAVPWGVKDGVVGIMPSYLLFRRPNLAYAHYFRVGYQLLIAPPTGGNTADLANGFELGAGFIYYVRAGLGVVVEADADYFAGVDDALVFGGHAGIAVGYEILP